MQEVIYVGSLISDDYISHHGILGQKWGHKNGPPYPLGEGDHSAAEKKAGWKKSLSNKAESIKKTAKKVSDINKAATAQRYKNLHKDMTDEEATDAAERRAKLMKKVAIGAGVAIGVSAGIWAARSLGRTYFDQTIKAGTTIQTLSAHTDRMNDGKAFYTAFREGDKQKYIGGFGRAPVTVGGGLKNKIQADVTDNIKVAGFRNANKIYKDLMKNNSEFRDAVLKSPDHINWWALGNRSDYTKFNTYNLLNNDPKTLSKETAKAQELFYNALKEKGYGAVSDINDTQHSGYNTKAAIVFDRSGLKKDASGKVIQRVSKLTDEEADKGQKYFMQRYAIDAATHPANVAAWAWTVNSLAGQSFDKKVAREQAKKRKERLRQEKKG